MGFFTAYFDESGKHQKEKVVSFCGLLETDWIPFEDEWGYLLRKHKISDLHFSKDPLRATAKQLDVYRPFVHAIAKHVEHGFGFAVDVAAFNATHKAVRTFYRNDPHYLVFQAAVREVVKYVSSQPDPIVSIVCDDDSQKACECYKSFDVMRQNTKQPENRQILRSISFADAKFFKQLQAADLFSWVCRAEALYRYSGKDYSLRELWREFNMTFTDRRIVYSSGFWDAKRLADFDLRVVRALGKKEIDRIENT